MQRKKCKEFSNFRFYDWNAQNIPKLVFFFDKIVIIWVRIRSWIHHRTGKLISKRLTVKAFSLLLYHIDDVPINTAVKKPNIQATCFLFKKMFPIQKDVSFSKRCFLFKNIFFRHHFCLIFICLKWHAKEAFRRQIHNFVLKSRPNAK